MNADPQGKAALAAALRQFPVPETLEELAAATARTYESDAAAILGERGVFLPDGYATSLAYDTGFQDGVGSLAEMIASLRAALEAIEDEHRADEHPEWAGWYGEPGERPDAACRTCGTFDEYAVHWPCDTAKIARAALTALRAEVEAGGYHGEGEFDLHYDPWCPRCTARRDLLRPEAGMDQIYATTEEADR